MDQHARELQSMSTSQVNDNSNRMLMNTRNLQLKRLFSTLGGDGKGHISRGKGKLRINVGDPLINGAVVRVLLKHFNSSTQKLVFEVFKRLCMHEFKTPLQDGFSLWHRLTKIQQGLELADFKDSYGIDISVDPSDTEDGPEPNKRPLNMSMSGMVQRGSPESKRAWKTHHEKSVFARLCERNLEKEKMLEAIRQQKLEEEMGECCFYPRIKGSSPGSPPRRMRPDFYERKLDQEKQKERRLEEARREKAFDSLKECTFQPKVGRSLHATPKRSPKNQVPSDSWTASPVDSRPTDPNASPLALHSPAAVRFSYRELQASQGDNGSPCEPALQRFVIGGGRRAAVNQHLSE